VEALYYTRSLASGLEFETDMRWFVEVSRVGENGVADEYCVEAKQWQAALQEARKLRGDTGALSKFSIELLDRGYRAVDPSLKLRYLINEAPPDAPLTGSSESSKKHDSKPEQAISKLRAGDSLTPSAYATSLAPTPFTTSLAPPATSSSVPRPTSHPAPRPTSVIPPRVAPVEPAQVAPAEPAQSVRPEPAQVAPAEPPRAARLLVPNDPVPPAPAAPGMTLPSQPPAPPVPQFELVRERAEEPRPDSPITYREFAYAVEPGRTRAEIEALLRDRYQATRAAIEDRPPGKFVQLAVFDHVFKRRPERPPLATFAWKDWRGDPVLAFPGFGEAAMAPMSRVPPPRESVPPPSNGAVAVARTSVAPESAALKPIVPVVIASVPPPPTQVIETPPAPSVDVEITIDEAPPEPSVDVEISIDEAVSAPQAAPIPIAAPTTPSAELEIAIVEAESAPALAQAPAVSAPAVSAPSVAPAPIPIVEGARAPEVEPPLPTQRLAAGTAPPFAEGVFGPVVEAPAPVVEGARKPVVEAPVVGAAPSAPSFELTFEAPAVHAVSPAPSNPVSIERGSRPRIASEGRRRAGEDLIGELFEIMHELNFAHDVAEGAEFVLSVLNELLPCEGVLIHVFDINTGHFVVVRAKGPHANAVLLQRMSDQDPLVRSVMRSSHASSVKDAAKDPRFAGPRWRALGVTPRAALCGGVQLSGRYLGLIEIANPHGDLPFHQSELNALDYICEQFAAFLSKKPIVLSADVVLSRV